MEFLFVDDCGTDGSMSAVEEFAKEDGRVRILRNEMNLGAGHSRNRGIEAARGEYLSFVDPDDWLAPDFFCLLYRRAKESGADIVKGVRAYSYGEQGDAKLSRMSVLRNMRMRRALRHGIPLYFYFVSEHQTALYKRELFLDGTVRNGTSYVAQDTTFLLRCCKMTSNLTFENRAVYYYQKGRQGAATNGYTLHRSEQELVSFREKVDYLLEKPMDVHAYMYLQARAREYSSHIYYAAHSSGTEEIVQKEQEAELMRQIRRLPDQAAMKKHYPELDVLFRYGRLIPVYERRADGINTARISEWASLLEECPGTGWKQTHGMAYAIVYSYAKGAFTLLLRHSLKKDDPRFSLRRELRKTGPRKRAAVLAALPLCVIEIMIWWLQYWVII